MIHVAPCSCELHVRIRELEADIRVRDVALATYRRLKIDPAYVEVLARAEKAERERDQLKHWHENHGVLQPYVKSLEARVAELVEEINLIIRYYQIEDYDLSVLRKPAPATVGDETPSQGVQEREAD